MDQVVADASVIVKFFVNEEYTDNANRLRDSYISKQIDLIEPSLLKYEVINGIRFSKAKRFSLEEIKLAIEALEDYNFNIFNLNGVLATKASELTFEYHISIYDAIYIGLAAITNSILYTADDKLIKAVNLPFIKHIKEFG